MAGASKNPDTTPTANPTDPDGGDSSYVGRLERENDRLRAKLEDQDLQPVKPEPYTASFAMSEGTRQDLEQQKARADKDGRPYAAKLGSGAYRYGVTDPMSGRVFTPSDLDTEPAASSSKSTK